MGVLLKGLFKILKTPLILIALALGLTSFMDIAIEDIVNTFILIAIGLFFIWMCFKLYKK